MATGETGIGCVMLSNLLQPCAKILSICPNLQRIEPIPDFESFQGALRTFRFWLGHFKNGAKCKNEQIGQFYFTPFTYRAGWGSPILSLNLNVIIIFSELSSLKN